MALAQARGGERATIPQTLEILTAAMEAQQPSRPNAINNGAGSSPRRGTGYSPVDPRSPNGGDGSQRLSGPNVITPDSRSYGDQEWVWEVPVEAGRSGPWKNTEFNPIDPANPYRGSWVVEREFAREEVIEEGKRSDANKYSPSWMRAFGFR